MRKVWTDELDRYLKANYMMLSDNQLIQKIKFKFGIALTELAIKSRRQKLGLVIRNRKPIAKKYTEEIINYIIKNYEGKDNIDLSNELNEKFNLDTNNDKIGMLKANIKRRYGLDLRTGINKGHFGKTPWNKGKKGLTKSNSGSFKKGNIPPNRREVFEERISKDGYVEIKVQDGKLNDNWQFKHRYIYEQKNREIPKDYIVSFADGNIKNFDIDNLILVSKAENLILNRYDLRANDTEITKTALNLAKMICKINETKKKNN